MPVLKHTPSIEIFTSNGGHFKYNADGTVGNISFFDGTPTTYCADIDPVSKTWFAFGNKFYASNAFSGTKNLDKTYYICCWSPKLQYFCTIRDDRTAIVDLNGNIQGTSLSVSFHGSGGSTVYEKESLLWSDTLDKFILPNHQYGTSIYVSSDGLNWDLQPVNLVGNFPNLPTGDKIEYHIYHICWMPMVKKFVCLCGVYAYDNDDNFVEAEEYMITSSDCNNWERIEKPKQNKPLQNLNVKPAYSPEKKVLAFVGLNTSYITRDLQNWTEVPNIEGNATAAPKSIRWSKSLNGFIRPGINSETRFYRLVIDN